MTKYVKTITTYKCNVCEKEGLDASEMAFLDDRKKEIHAVNSVKNMPSGDVTVIFESFLSSRFYYADDVHICKKCYLATVTSWYNQTLKTP